MWIIWIYLYLWDFFIICVWWLSFILWLIMILICKWFGGKFSYFSLLYLVSFVVLIILMWWLRVVFLFFLLYCGIRKEIFILGYLVNFMVNFLFKVESLFLVDFYFDVSIVICNLLGDGCSMLCFWDFCDGEVIVVCWEIIFLWGKYK